MRKSLVLASLAAALVAVVGPAAYSKTAPSATAIEGVWKVTKVVRTGPNAGTDMHPQPSLAIYARGYFSILRDNGSEPRRPAPPPVDPAHPTDAEKIAKYDEWASYSASGGTYEVKGDRLITHNVVAKQAAGSAATEEAAIVAFSADTLVVRPAPTPFTPPGEVVERTYTRIR